MIYFDHTFTRDDGHKLLKRMQRLGFTLNPTTVEHEGKHMCRFIMFPTQGRSSRKSQYLEFIHVPKGGERVKKPGLMLGAIKGLEALGKKLKRSAPFDAIFTHKNYEWKTNSKDRLPGWNFLGFKNHGVRGYYTYMLEYEPSPSRKKSKIPAHANGVYAIHAIEMGVNKVGYGFLSQVFGKKLKPSQSLVCGTKLNLFPGRHNEISRVILKSKNVSTFISKYKVDEEITWNGQPAALIRNPSGMWDIVVI